MANVDNPNGFQYEGSKVGTGAAPLLKVLVKSAVDLAEGDAVIMLTTGLVTIAASTSGQIYGVAAEPLTALATAQSKTLIYPAARTAIFSGQCSGTGAQTDVGEMVDIEGTTGVMELNEDANIEAVAMIIGLKPGSAFGANARFLFTWVKSSYEGLAAAL